MRFLPKFSLVTAIALCVTTTQAQQAKQSNSYATAHSLYGPDPAEPTGPMPLIAPVFLQTDQVDSNLTVVNGVNNASSGFVTLRDMAGNVVIRKPFTFPAHSSTVLTITSLLAEAKSVIHSGSLTVEQDASIKGPALLGQLSMTLHVGSQGTFLEEELGMPSLMHNSRTLRGVASQTANAPLIAVTSNSEAAQTITATCVGENTFTTIELPSRETAVVRACSWEPMHDLDLGLASALLQEKQQSPPKNHAIELSTDAVPGAFYAFGFALNGTITHAQLQPLDFYDPGQAFSTKTVYVGVPIGNHKLLPDGTYAPTMTLANFSSQPRTAEVLFADSSGTQPKVTSVAQVTVAALSSKTLQLSGVTGTGVQNTLTVSSDGKPGDIQVHLFAGQTGTEHRVEMLAKDPKDDHNGGNHPWSTANNDQSTLLLHNPTATGQTFQVQISGSGSTWVDLFTLLPSETKSVSINDIISNQTKDRKGNVLPTTLASGEVLWYTPMGASGLGRLMISNATSGLARSFSCATYSNMCGTSLGPFSYLDFPDGGFGTISAINVTQCTEYCPNCCSQTSPTGSGYSFSTQWSNNSPSIVNVNSSSSSQIQLKGIGPGSFGVTALVSEGSCSSPPLGGGGNVRQPTKSQIVRSTATAFTSCGTNAYTHRRDVYEQIVDQSGTPFTDNGVTVGETITGSTPDDFQWAQGVQTGSGPTANDPTSGSNGVFHDALFNCDVALSSCIIGSGNGLQSNLNQSLSYGGAAVNQSNHLQETCAGFTVNGK